MGDTEMESISAEKNLLPSKILEASQDNESFTNKRTDMQKKKSTLFSSYINYQPKDNQYDYIKNDKKEKYLNRPQREYPDLDGLYLLVRKLSKNEGKDLDVFVRNHSRFSLRVSIKEYEKIKNKQNEKVKQLYKSYRDYFPKIKTKKTQCFGKKCVSRKTLNVKKRNPKAKAQKTKDIPSIMPGDGKNVDMTSTDADEKSMSEISKDANISQNSHKIMTVIDEDVEIEKDHCFRPNETSTDAAEISIGASASQNIGNFIDTMKSMIKRKSNQGLRPEETSQRIGRPKRKKKTMIVDKNVEEGYSLVPNKRSTDSFESDEREIMSDDEHNDESLSQSKALIDIRKLMTRSACCLYHLYEEIQNENMDIKKPGVNTEICLSEPDIKSDGSTSMFVVEDVEEGYWLVPKKKTTDAAKNSLSKTSKDCCISQDIGLPNDESSSDDESEERVGFGREAYIVSKLSKKKAAKWYRSQESEKIEQVADNLPQNEVSQKTLKTLLNRDNERSTDKLKEIENDKGPSKFTMQRFMPDLKSQKEYTIPDECTVQDTPKQDIPEHETAEHGTAEHGTAEHGTAEHGTAEQGTPEQEASDQGTVEQGTAERDSRTRNPRTRCFGDKICFCQSCKEEIRIQEHKMFL